MNRNDIRPLLSVLQENAKRRQTGRFELEAHQKGKEEFNQVRDKIRHMDEVELFYGLYPFAVQNVFDTPAGYAAVLLYGLNPPCQITCQQAIRALLSDWDVSTEEIPFYLVKQFGKGQMKDAIKRIRGESLTKDEKILLDTVEYWTNLAKD